MRSRAIRGPLWVIAKHEHSRMVVLTTGCGGETLPVFSHEEEAEAYLWLAGVGAGWRARRTTAGELISVLYGPCAGAKEVALDPLPAFGGTTIADLVSLDRERFVRSLMDGRGPSASPQSPLRRGAVGFGTSESLAEKGARMRKNEERRERTQSEAVARHELGRRLFLGSAPCEEDGARDGVVIPDYVMMDFGSLDRDGLRDNPDGRHRAPEGSDVDEGLVQDRE